MASEQLHIYEILAKQHEPMLIAYILSLVADAQLAEDIAQETLLIAYRKIATLKKPESFGPWLRGIARFEIFAALRKQGREIPCEPAVFEGMEDVFGSLEQQEITDRWQERFQLVEDCFQQLPEKLREICALHYFEDRKTRDIADLLRLGLNVVLKRLERARAAIKECVQRRLKMGEA